MHGGLHNQDKHVYIIIREPVTNDILLYSAKMEIVLQIDIYSVCSLSHSNVQSFNFLRSLFTPQLMEIHL